MAQADEPQYPTYGSIVSRKLTSSIANLTTSGLEIPKCVIIENNAQNANFIYGFLGGGMEGAIHTVGRMAIGLVDLLTLPIPTRPSIDPLYVWDDFDKKTAYGPVLRLEEY